MAIFQATQAVMDIRQTAMEDEMVYSARLFNAIYRCGNVFDDAQKMTFFINGLIPEIQSIVARYRESTPRSMMRFEILSQYACDEGQAYRARFGHNSQQPPNSPAVGATPAHFIGQGNPPSDIADEPGQIDAQQLMFTAPGAAPDNRDVPSNVHTKDLPVTEDLPMNDPQVELFALKVIRPPAIPGGNAKNRPGWVNRRDTVCYQCYAINKHIAPDCDLQLHELGKVVSKYEALTPSNRELVPKAAYSMAKQLIKVNGATPLLKPMDEGSPSSPKN